MVVRGRMNDKIQTFISFCRIWITDSLCPRNGYFDVRTYASRLYQEAAGDEKILHYDFASLYPSVNKNHVYPIGHPEIILSDLGNVNNYF